MKKTSTFWKSLLIIFTSISLCINIFSQSKPTSPLQNHSVPSDENLRYTINLMWINSKLREEQELICPANQPCLAQMLSWASKNPESEVNFWFDSEKTTTDQLQKMQTLIQSERTESMAPIRLKDIRTLSEVKKNKKVFSDTRIPVYFRADLLRVIAGVNEISQNMTDHFVYADLDMEAISKAELFDKKTVHDLNQYGIVMAKSDSFLKFENGFQIISNHKPHLLEALKHAIIDLNFIRAHNAFEGKLYNILDRQPNGPFRPLEQIVYDSYEPMFAYFYQLENCGACKATLNWGGGEVDYDKENHGLRPFGLTSVRNRIRFIPEKDWCGKKSDYATDLDDVLVPTKKVNIPPAAFNYKDE